MTTSPETELAGGLAFRWREFQFFLSLCFVPRENPIQHECL